MKKMIMASLVRQIRGVSYKPEDVRTHLDDSSVILLRANNIGDGVINFDDVIYVDQKRVSAEQYLQKGDILICASSGSKNLVGKAAKIDFEGTYTFGAFCKVVRPKNREDADYISMYFQSPVYRRVISSQALGININNIRKEHIDCLSVNWPENDRRTQTVEVLSKVLSIINARKQEILALDELIKARFVEMFGDPILNTQNRPTSRFVDVVMMQRGFDLPVQDRQQDGNILVYGSNGPLGKHNIAKVQGGGIITGRSGTIGNVYYTKDDFWPLNTTLFSVNTNGNNIVYLSYLLRLYDLSRFIEGTGVPTLNRNKFHNMSIITVPLIEQKVFSDFVIQVEKIKASVQKALDKAQFLFDSIIQKSFNIRGEYENGI